MPEALAAAAMRAGLEPERAQEPGPGRVPGVLGPALAQRDLLELGPEGLLRIST